jgi:hypothetical protein
MASRFINRKVHFYPEAMDGKKLSRLIDGEQREISLPVLLESYIRVCCNDDRDSFM